jgi:hypothetical protein
MTMIGFDVAKAEPDLVGFSVEVKSPEASDFEPLRNRMNAETGKGDRGAFVQARRPKGDAGLHATRAHQGGEGRGGGRRREGLQFVERAVVKALKSKRP